MILTFALYKSIEMQIWPCPIKVKCKPTVIIWINFLELDTLMLLEKILVFYRMWTLCWDLNDTSALAGRFVSSPMKTEKTDRESRVDERGTGKKEEQEWKWRHGRNKNIPPSTFTYYKDSRPSPTVSQYQLDMAAILLNGTEHVIIGFFINVQVQATSTSVPPSPFLACCSHGRSYTISRYVYHEGR